MTFSSVAFGGPLCQPLRNTGRRVGLGKRYEDNLGSEFELPIVFAMG